MADQTNRLSYTAGKGGFIRFIWKPSIISETASCVVLPSSNYTYEFDPNLENMTEADSFGEYWAPTVEKHMIRVDLRRRQGSMALDALGLRAATFIDRVVIDIGNSGYCTIIDHMSVGPYNRGNPQLQNVAEGFSLMGGRTLSQYVTIPSYAVLGGTIPAISAYYAATGSVPSGL